MTSGSTLALTPGTSSLAPGIGANTEPHVGAGRARLRHLAHDPRVSLTVLDSESWYSHISLHGRATQPVDDPDLTDIDRLSVHYTGGPYADRADALVLAWMDVESRFAWNGGAPWQPA